jgi:bifunctional non-homologous end joining protein LigD
MGLKLYQKKRNFKKTPEPKGRITASSAKKKRLFIIQKHAASHLHYDLRLELNGVLLSWAVPKGPCLDPTVKRLAMHVEDHPLEYGSFEGTIPKGEYGGGTVMLWDKGYWLPEDDHPNAAYEKGHLTFQLHAKKLNGRWSLIRLKKAEKSWLLIKSKDEFAKSIKKFDVTVKEPNSVKTGKNLQEIAGETDDPPINLKQKSMPKKISPELATLVDKAPEGKEWVHEVKFDGYRLIAFKQNKQTKLFTRNQNDWTDKFTKIAAMINKLKIKDAIFDGEIVVLDQQHRSNFQLLQNSIKSGLAGEFIYYIFDLLYYDKYDLRNLSLLERKKMLQKLLPKNHHYLRFSDHVFGSGKQIFKKSCQLGLEGIVSKLSNSPYIESRTKDWLKTKCVKRQEFIICGFTPPQRSRQFFGALLLGTYNKHKELIYHGNVGTGFTQASLQHIYKKMLPYKTEVMPFKQKPSASSHVTWLKPKLVGEVEFTEWTKENSLRHPSFKGLREDKPAKQIIKEKPHKI